jgi:hypothetical protein
MEVETENFTKMASEEMDSAGNMVLSLHTADVCATTGGGENKSKQVKSTYKKRLRTTIPNLEGTKEKGRVKRALVVEETEEVVVGERVKTQQEEMMGGVSIEAPIIAGLPEQSRITQ